MKTVSVRIKGRSALLMHAFPASVPDGLEKKPAAEQVELHLYRDDEGKITVPAECIRRALVGAATYSKGKGRASLAKEAAAAIFVEPTYCSLTPQTYTIDSRPVVIPATRGRVIRHRACWQNWELSFQVTYDEVLLKEEQVQRIVSDAGQRVGLLDYRPEKKGPFGRFDVTLFE